MTIDYANLRQLDLNLLLAFDILVEEASVTQAAEKLNMSQSAMSHALKRLRQVLDDPILIRTSQRQMEVTPYAREISPQVRQVLTDIQETLLAKDVFDPATAQEDFRIATNDYVEATLSAHLLPELMQQAPEIQVRIAGMDKDTALASLDNNSIDLFIGAGLDLKRWHIREALYQEEFVCVAQSDCPLTELSMEEYAARSHILVSLQDDFRGVGDLILEQQQQSRRVVWSTPHFMAVPFMLANSDCVALLPKRMAERCAREMGLKLLPPPIDVTGFTVSMVWHQRHNNRPQHQWLRSQLIAAAQRLSDL
ncbi:MAG: LysR family transcriptional regulator [Cyanobacteria bacterium P01_A01_bin.17]